MKQDGPRQNNRAVQAFPSAWLRSRAARLLKTTIRGGILTLTSRELVLGEGVLGARNIRRFALNTLVRLEVAPSPQERGLRRTLRLSFVWADGTITDVDRVGLIAARRIRHLLQTLCPSAVGGSAP